MLSVKVIHKVLIYNIIKFGSSSLSQYCHTAVDGAADIIYIFIHHIMVAQQKKIYNKKIEQLN